MDLAAQHDQPPHGVLQLANVARPRVVAEQLDRVRRELDRPIVLFVESSQEVRDQGGDSLWLLSERRNPDLYHVEPVVEVFPEVAPGDRGLEVAIGDRHDSRVGLDRLPPTEAGELEILEHVKELGLEQAGHLSDLIQADRAPIRELEFPGLPGVRSGEGALLVAEEFGFQELRGKRRTVDLHERAPVPR